MLVHKSGSNSNNKTENWTQWWSTLNEAEILKLPCNKEESIHEFRAIKKKKTKNYIDVLIYVLNLSPKRVQRVFPSPGLEKYIGEGSTGILKEIHSSCSL